MSMHFHFFYEMFEAYRIMWRNLWGAHYGLPLETPKPLIILLSALFDQSANIVIVPLCLLLWLWAIARLTKIFGGGAWHAAGAAIFCIFCNGEVIPYYLIYGFALWPIVYLPLMFWAAVLFLERHYSRAFVCLFFAGLLRPDAWLAAVILLLFLFWRKEKVRGVYFLSLAAPLLWCLIDYRISGDFFYSAAVTAHYAKITDFFIKPTSFAAYWPWVMRIMAEDYSFILVPLGIAAFIFRQRITGKEGWRERAVMTAVLAPCLVYWFVCLGGNITIQSRFFALPMLYLTFYAVFLSGFCWGRRLDKMYEGFYIFGVLIISFLFVDWGHNGWQNGLIAQTNRPAYIQAVDFLTKDERALKADFIIMPVRWSDDLSLDMGEDISRKIVLFRDLSAGELISGKQGLALYFTQETSGFGFLKDLSEYNVNICGRAYLFKPVFSDVGCRCIVYSVSAAPVMDRYKNSTEGVMYEVVSNSTGL